MSNSAIAALAFMLLLIVVATLATVLSYRHGKAREARRRQATPTPKPSLRLLSHIRDEIATDARRRIGHVEHDTAWWRAYLAGVREVLRQLNSELDLRPLDAVSRELRVGKRG